MEAGATSMESTPAQSALTPMMRQYFAVKSEHPQAIVLFRIGDFFETFYDDAVEASKLLDLTLTSRSKEKDPVPMAGVPHHAVDNYVSRLVDAGKTVVLVDQVEDAKLAKGLVKREITDILSPGTFLDPHAPARLATYLCALAFDASKKSTRWGLCVLDLSTGEFRAASGEDDDVLADELLRLGAREILISEADAESPRLSAVKKELPKTAFTAVPAETFHRGGEDAMARTFGKEELGALQSVHAKIALSAAGAALAYVEKMQPRKGQFDARAPVLFHLKELRPYEPGEGLVLDKEARAHLELFRSASDGSRRGTLIGAIDEAETAMGGRFVARCLAYPLRNKERIRKRQDAIAALVETPSAVDRIREELRSMNDLERLVGRSVLHRATPRDLGAVRASLEKAPRIFEAARRAARGGDARDLIPAEGGANRSARLEALASTDPAAQVADLLARALVDVPPIDLDQGDVFRAGYDAELDRLSLLAKSGKDLIARMEAEEKDKTGIASLKVRYNRVFGYYIEVTKANLKLVPPHYIRKQTTANGERYFTEALQKLEGEVLSAEEKRLERAQSLFSALVDEVAKEARRILAVAHALAELDALSGFARVAEKRGWVRPEIADDGAIEILDGRHPVLELYTEELGERFVPNDLSISSERSLMIITGPNMAGKSTIMRQTALIVILAHMGLFVPARSAKIALVDRIFTRVGASDDLSRGRSTFMVEMNETARILRAATSRSLILLDEIGRGTSTFDGLSIAWAVAEFLHDTVGAKTLFATHYHELTEISRDKLRASNHHVAVKEWNEQIVFLRKLLPGSTNRSYGVQVARIAGLPRSVVDRAKEVLASLEAQALSAGDGSRMGRSAPPGDRRQLFLFAEPPPGNDPLEEVARALEAMEIDDITPRQALDELARLKAMLPAKAKR